jgi:hypothetical protein
VNVILDITLNIINFYFRGWFNLKISALEVGDQYIRFPEALKATLPV